MYQVGRHTKRYRLGNVSASQFVGDKYLIPDNHGVTDTENRIQSE